MEITPGKFELRRHANDLGYARQNLETLLQARWNRRADHANDRLGFALDHVGLQSRTLDSLDDIVDMFAIRIRTHDDDHCTVLLASRCSV